MNAENSPEQSRTPGWGRKLRVVWIVLLIGATIWLFEEFIKDRVFAKRFGVVEANLIYRSGQLSSALVERTLRKHGIRRIVDLTSIDPNDSDERAERQAAAELGIEILTLPLRGDATGDPNHYVEAIEAIVESRRRKEPVLVHCAAGAQRTGATIALYRLLVEGRSPQFVLQELERYDWDPKDDTALPDYVNAHIAEIAARLKERGVIEQIPSPLPQLHVGK